MRTRTRDRCIFRDQLIVHLQDRAPAGRFRPMPFPSLRDHNALSESVGKLPPAPFRVLDAGRDRVMVDLVSDDKVLEDKALSLRNNRR